MQRKGILCIGMLVLLIIFASALVYADNGGY